MHLLHISVIHLLGVKRLDGILKDKNENLYMCPVIVIGRKVPK